MGDNNNSGLNSLVNMAAWAVIGYVIGSLLATVSTRCFA